MTEKEKFLTEQQTNKQIKMEQEENQQECAICLQPCMQPVQLPCQHVFCFLCAKGTAMQNRKCALCRSPIPDNFITRPNLFKKVGEENIDDNMVEARYVWFYEGTNGWWQYDDRTCQELECAFAESKKSIDVLIAGNVYVIDFENSVQFQRNRNSKIRKIKRDFTSAPKKGVAGLHGQENRNVVGEASTSTSKQDNKTQTGFINSVFDIGSETTSAGSSNN